MELPQAELKGFPAMFFFDSAIATSRATARRPYGTGWSPQSIEPRGGHGRIAAAKGSARGQGISPEELDRPHLPKRC